MHGSKNLNRFVQVILLFSVSLLLLLCSLFLYQAHKPRIGITKHYVVSYPSQLSETGPSHDPSSRIARQISASELMSRPLAKDLTEAPKLFHQSWSGTELPAKFKHWSHTCRAIHADWEWVLWTDDDNVKLVEKYVPWFVDIYDYLPSEIYRADAMRNIYMIVFGG